MFRRRAKTLPRSRQTSDPVDDVGYLLAETATRIETLIGVAERTASSVRQQAEATVSEDSDNQRDRIARELSLGLVDRVDALRDEASELRRVLERASRVFGQSEAARERRPVTHDFQPPVRIEPPRGLEPSSSAAEGSSEQPSQGVVLLATQMAVAGSAREEIAVRLRKDFGVTDTEAVLARALGGA